MKLFSFAYKNNDLTKVLALYKLSTHEEYKNFVLKLLSEDLVEGIIDSELEKEIKDTLLNSSTTEVKKDDFTKEIRWNHYGTQVTWSDTDLNVYVNETHNCMIKNTTLIAHFEDINNELNKMEVVND